MPKPIFNLNSLLTRLIFCVCNHTIIKWLRFNNMSDEDSRIFIWLIINRLEILFVTWCVKAAHFSVFVYQIDCKQSVEEPSIPLWEKSWTFIDTLYNWTNDSYTISCGQCVGLHKLTYFLLQKVFTFYWIHSLSYTLWPKFIHHLYRRQYNMPIHYYVKQGP